MEYNICTPARHYCNCSNQLLLAPGCECDVCMGIVAEHEPQPMTTEPSVRYDHAYFEALERMYCSFEYAA